MPDYIIFRRNVKYARISIGPELAVKIVLPLRFPERELVQLLEQKARWIEKQLAHFRTLKENSIPLDEGEILFLGEAHRPGAEVPRKGRALEQWYRDQAKQYFTERVALLAEQHGFSYNRMIIRGSKSRWGTCSAKKNVAFNWRLMKAPPAAIDYVILHELVHTVVFDHSKRFWAALEAVCPQYKVWRKWLKEEGGRLES